VSVQGCWKRNLTGHKYNIRTVHTSMCQQWRRSLDTRSVECIPSPCTIDKGQSVRYVNNVKTVPGPPAHLDHFGTSLCFSLVFIYIPEHPDQSWSPHIHLLNGCRELLLGFRAVGAWSRHLKFLCGKSRCEEDTQVDHNRQAQPLLYTERFNPIIAHCIIGVLE
jgi:hypothetical protein